MATIVRNPANLAYTVQCLIVDAVQGACRTG
jgi:hypothetical protein